MQREKEFVSWTLQPLEDAVRERRSH
uniref:Uncharacterized protein n=1 Tax=Rhizophora mucronata TaxID=61149 RepID=A0A2P2QPB2_RHIMU